MSGLRKLPARTSINDEKFQYPRTSWFREQHHQTRRMNILLPLQSAQVTLTLPRLKRRVVGVILEVLREVSIIRELVFWYRVFLSCTSADLLSYCMSLGFFSCVVVSTSLCISQHDVRKNKVLQLSSYHS